MSPPLENLSQKLLRVLKPYKRVLEVGGEGRLAKIFCLENPETQWTCLPTSLNGMKGSYDAVLLNNVLEKSTEPRALLSRLRESLDEGTRLFLVVDNSVHISTMERMLIGDFEIGNGVGQAINCFSPSSICRLLLDEGWLPNLVDQLAIGHENEALKEHLVATAEAVGVPLGVSKRNLFLSQLIFECTFAPKPTEEGALSLSVVVPINNDLQFNLNVVPSPGLSEVDAEFVQIRGARNAAEALEAGRKASSGEWILFCHQDVYFPRGFGNALAKLLGNVPAELAKQKLVGFAGLTLDSHGQSKPAGLVIDRLERFSHPECNGAVSFDELAVVLHRDCVFRLDPNLGWHLWGTDLCLQAQASAPPSAVSIARIPLFHNSLNDYGLSDAYRESEAYLKSKYPQRALIHSLCGKIV